MMCRLKFVVLVAFCTSHASSAVSRPTDAIHDVAFPTTSNDIQIEGDENIEHCATANYQAMAHEPSCVETDNNYEHDQHEQYYQLPWNPSPNIDRQGYLRSLYRRIPGSWESPINSRTRVDVQYTRNSPVIVRQVPGDGNCLFHSIAVCLIFAETGRQFSMDNESALRELKRISHGLRMRAVECLNQWSVSSSSSASPNNYGRFNPEQKLLQKKRYKRLFIQGKETILTKQLVEAAASQYGISGEEYCDLMAKDAYWGGGPEIVALSNVLQRPIHVYELVDAQSEQHDGGGDMEVGCGNLECIHCGGSKLSHASNNGRGNDSFVSTKTNRKSVKRERGAINQTFHLRRMAAFGSPKFDDKEPLNILSADSRFPDVSPSHLLENGNHFLAMFPVTPMRMSAERIRGGSSMRQKASDKGAEHNDRVVCACIVKGSHFAREDGGCSVLGRPKKQHLPLRKMLRWTLAFILETLHGGL